MTPSLLVLHSADVPKYLPFSTVRNVCEGVRAPETPDCIVDHVATVMEKNSPFSTWAHVTLHRDSQLKDGYLC